MGCLKEEEFVVSISNQKKFLKYYLNRKFHIFLISSSLSDNMFWSVKLFKRMEALVPP